MSIESESEVIWVCMGDSIDWVDSVDEIPEGGKQVTEIDACMFFCFETIVKKISYARNHALYGVVLLQGTIIQQMMKVAEELTKEGEWQDEVWRRG